ncbi:putative Developmentally-regulated GTP-binding protein 2 [Monocercomonoides exilis]|uniref:putative Developmentally-regulated GTP-binding protein 2 n=1 Tax=Monocercomonoides exilis TaxID=2049356 RepID=UPI00355A7AE1|nr:putative Developmentally-regulated GTP-binding protein 2 [Monocercomonoides exilis]|eukprot:MONOS_3349.1-p1 / transcript=MONOS_3349.1 / gene=MONOS_3349 / organism=Monocercomonoides_exilis_PA203 / gene_product=Developmentally-regulated GTP-binding protein 2 / transcript_product=Developmentally-regulated GTP-binding protein 2 / location=Mono_scaffold00078:56931-58511(-) / protein_length=373 / sequence_SO=supercontig / SO=protein_coding / is_pseudo=false
MSLTAKIKDIELELSRTQKNKRTEYHIGLLKGKLARYRAQLLEFQTKSSGGSIAAFEVGKTGDARVALVGFPSVGKSSLLNHLTDAKSCIASYEFTTLTCVPGVLELKGARVQILDLPGIITGASAGKGRGKQVIATARTADCIMMVLDAAGHPNQSKLLTEELETMGIRINRKPPHVSFKAKSSGGVSFTSTVPLTHLDERFIKQLLHDYHIFHAEILFHEDCTADDLIDVIEMSRNPSARVYVPCLYVYNKIDQVSMEEIDAIARRPHSVVISCEYNLNMDVLLEELWRELDLSRIYTKTHSIAPDFGDPLVVKRGSSVQEVCKKIHKSLPDIVRFAIVWGTSVKYSPQRVGLSHVVDDEDVIEIVKKITI